MRRLIPLAALTAIVLACDSPNAPAADVLAAPVPGAVRTLRISMDTAQLIEGVLGHALLKAYDQSGMPLGTDRAQVVSSNPAVATIAASSLNAARDPRTGRIWQEQVIGFRLVAPGTASVFVTLDGVSDTLRLVVHPLRPSSSALVVESFTVIEYRATCAWACPYLVYAPLLKLREPTGSRTAEVVAVEFTLGNKSTGVCRGMVAYTPGRSAHLNPIYDYLWSNDLIFVSLNGQPLPGDSATARVTVRDASGNYSEVKASSAVQRMVANPVLPAPQSNDSGWNCQ